MHFTLRIAMAVLAVVSALLVTPVIREVRRRGRQAQTDLSFNTQAMKREFRLLFFGELFLLAGFAVYTVAAIGLHAYTTAGEVLIIAFFLFPLYVLYKWWRRLQ